MHTHRWQCSHSSTSLHLSVGLRRCCFSFSFSSSHTPSQSNATVIRLHNRWRVLSTIKTSTTSIQRAEKMKRKKVTKWQACSVCCAQQLQCDRDWRCRPKARRESIVSRWYSSKSNVASHANRDCLCEATGAFAHTQFNEPFCNSNNNHTIRNLNVVVFVSSRFHLSGVVARLRCVAWWLSLFLSPSVCVCVFRLLYSISIQVIFLCAKCCIVRAHTVLDPRFCSSCCLFRMTTSRHTSLHAAPNLRKTRPRATNNYCIGSSQQKRSKNERKQKLFEHNNNNDRRMRCNMQPNGVKWRMHSTHASTHHRHHQINVQIFIYCLK